ncbi:hypothetical protein [Streptomyces sp. NPDC056672]|uniref:hypothetical protein n=1 Tax=Streptomyces sp. NPDC056672 TaxID=3345906 RepID=UPI0036BD8F9B
MDRQGPRIATLTTATVLLVALGGAAATAVDRPKEPSELTLINTGVGQVLADENGNPLYLRLADKPDRPECAGKCATTWPAAVGFPTKATGVIGETAQTPLNAANSDQPHVIYNTHPLYYYKEDRPNQPKGQNVDGFSLVSADGKAVTDRNGSAATSPQAKPSASRTASSTSKAKPPTSKTPAAKTPTGKAPTSKAAKTPKTPKPPTPATSAGGRVPAPRTTTAAPTRIPPRITPQPQAPAATSTRAPAPKPIPSVAPVGPVQPGTGTAGTGTGTTGTGTGTSTTGTSTGKDTVPGPSVGNLQITPSGAARGGADHLTATDSVVRGTGTAELTLAIGATAAAALGTILVVRRGRRRATGDHH